MVEQKKPLLACRKLSKEFKTDGGIVHAVNDIDLDIFEGETLGLVGESGCGKSTLGRLILGLTPATQGSIQFSGQELTTMNKRQFRKVRKDIQCIFQDPYASLDPRRSIADSILEPLEINKIGSQESRQARLLNLLQTVGIPAEYMNRFPHQFSGGQRQRVGIARALALNPKLIVCDEPVSALDVSIQAQVLNLLADLQEQEHLTYLFISHDLNVVKRISNRVCIMYLGSICESGKTEEIFAHPRHPYTKFLLDAVPVNDPDDRKSDKLIITGDLPSPLNPPGGCLFHTRCPYATKECSQRRPKQATENGHLLACHHPLNS